MNSSGTSLNSDAPFDLLFRNGTVVDGSGSPRFAADVAIRGDQISKIGGLGTAPALRELDITGLVLSPGFIDVHTHDDAAVIARPEMTPKLTQGVTTVIGGNCGISGAPYGTEGDPPSLLRLVFKSDRFVAATLAEYLNKVQEAAPAVNSAFLTGHTTLRMQVMGEDLQRSASAAEIDQMRELLTECLEQGSLGLSTGLFYPPARAASTHEVIEVARPLASYRGIYTTHMRDEADGVLDSIKETVKIGNALGVPVVVSHHKCMGQRNFGRSRETLALLDEARRRHQAIACDVYPYTAASTVLNADMVAQSMKTLLTWCDPHPEFCGRDLEHVATALGCTAAQAIAQLQPAGALYFTMDEEDVTRIMCSAEAMIGSDGLPEDQHPHPRLWGTFPRVLGRYVRERSVLSLENAVHRMTGLSARHFGLHDRGRIAVGACADVCVFDPRTVRDSATFEQPTRSAIGIQYVVVNGKMALDRGIPTKIRAGKVLRRIG